MAKVVSSASVTLVGKRGSGKRGLGKRETSAARMSLFNSMLAILEADDRLASACEEFGFGFARFEPDGWSEGEGGE